MGKKLANSAQVFAALGDETRLKILKRLQKRQRCSISELTEGFAVSRQAVTKHLRVLENAGLVRAEREGRESLYSVADRGWDETLERLRAFVET